MKKLDPKLFDQRTLKRNLDKGLITEEDYLKYLKSLPDNQENFEEVPFEEEDPLMENTDEEETLKAIDL